MPKLWLNGSLLDADAARISPSDLGLLHAAGAFTTMRARRGEVWQLDRHLRRLRDTCSALSIPLSYTDDDLRTATSELLRANSLESARLRLTVTRGTTREDPDHGLIVEPTVLLTAQELQPYPRVLYERGMTVLLLDDWKLNPFDPQAGHKTLDYSSRFAAMQRARECGAQEAIWFNTSNLAQSGSLANLLLVKDGAIVTPPTQAELDADAALRERTRCPRSNVLPGTTRAALLELARDLQIDVRIEPVDVNVLLEAQEVLLSNSIMLLMPVSRIERHEVGNGKPGPVFHRLNAALRAHAD
jgi:branched-chain amino acid aminotransferase